MKSLGAAREAGTPRVWTTVFSSYLPEKLEPTVSGQSVSGLTSRVVFSQFRTQSTVHKKGRDGVALVDRDTGFPPALSAPSFPSRRLGTWAEWSGFHEARCENL